MIRWLLRLLALLAILVVVLLLPVARVELLCRGEPVDEVRTPLVGQQWHRNEARTLTTYPEWHIVHAYDDYARVIATGDPHDFGYARAIGGFWSSLCALAEKTPQHGGFTTDSKMTIYTIGVSFTLEMAMKALYEETLGRVATWIRGPEHSALDRVSARQAAEYATFLQQVPWYKWDFRRDAAELRAQAQGGFRDGERRFALGTEYRVKAAYAGVIENAVAQVGADALRLRMVLAGLGAEELSAYEGVELIETRPEGAVIETPRYRELTHILAAMAADGARFIEIAGNDDILFTAISDTPAEGALYSFARQGYGDTRSLMLVKVEDLAGILRGLADKGLTLEHIHDY